MAFQAFTRCVGGSARGASGVLGLISAPAHLGYLALFALIAAESAGVPLPGETALLWRGRPRARRRTRHRPLGAF